MKNSIRILVFVLAVITINLFTGCYKDRTVIVTKTDVITTPVSFSKDLVPIFNKSCNMSGCHNAGGQVPDLTASNAYKSLFEEDMIDVADPENSEIMGWLTGTIQPAMPIGAASNPSNINALMLAWITQGAKNN